MRTLLKFLWVTKLIHKILRDERGKFLKEQIQKLEEVFTKNIQENFTECLNTTFYTYVKKKYVSLVTDNNESCAVPVEYFSNLFNYVN